jgi:thiol:disulfide interchange protein DsbD
MLGFSSVFALPFFLLALFPSALSSLPKAGGWMSNIKVVMGFLEIAAAMKFISNTDLVWAWGILSRELFLAIWIGCSFLATFYILGTFKMKLDTPIDSVGGLRAAWAIVFASISFFLVGGLFGNSMGELDAFIPPKDYDRIINGGVAASVPVVDGAKKASNDPHAGWISSYEEGLALAKKENKSIFIDFTGFTCTNCRWMESNVFPQSEVASLMERMVKVQLFTDRRAEPYISNKKFQQERFGSIELPLYVVLTPQGDVIATKAFTRDLNEFITFLKKAS